jgi:hypothetical protein
LGYSGAGTRLGITIAVKTNTTTAANLTGVGADSYNSGSAANVSPAIANNAALGDIMLASISEVTNTGIAVTIPTFNGTYSATGISYGQTTLVNSDAHTAVTLTGASTGQVTSTVPVAIGAQVAGTEECWVKIAGSTAGAFIMAGTGFTGWGIGVGNASWASAGTSFIGLVGSVAFVTFTGAPSMVAGTVYHVVAENDASNFFVWVNGTKYTGSNHGGSAPTSVLSLGEDNNSNYITATEQKCAYYDYELSATQIANHYLAGTTAPAGYAGAGVTGGATYDAVIQNDGPDVYWNLGESSGTTATNIGQMGLTWTQLPASAVVNESATISNSTYWAPAIGGHGHAQFNFGSNPAASDGIIADFGNINTTTPIDSSNSLVNQGLAASVSASLPAPTATDELVAVFQSYATCASPIASQATGTNYPQTIIGSGRASAYVMTADFASTWQLVDACTGPFASIAVGLSAATTPTRTTAQMRIQQQMESIFSLAPAPLPPGGSWFF